ncbi:ABC transporter substrate-binding protein [Actinopolymorpha pittospori]|uniref:Peptide/nickel transport system substrate-binding protein n=1 Tax=Actinopolymorpha pittospori TaxID=648752 RepID=A0A927MWA7_9ACTN|nr:ABC transporter substrate-binding protein [Actinopolymorpha pittospori]MBE1604482.1 peptide/nickel transport system substrate-binding protein [Actinopolymorpha pittospori]
MGHRDHATPHDTSRSTRAFPLTRRRFLTAGVTGAALATSGCSFFATDPDKEGDAGPTSAPRTKEAPALAAQVKAGDLPALADRLPAKPVVVKPVERVGRYGGTWRTALVGSADEPWMQRTIDWEGLLRHNPTFDAIVPNVAEAYEVNDDATEYVFTLREGMKWSDGEPFGVNDVMFWYSDYFTNADLTPVQDANFLTRGRPVVVAKLDERRVAFRFEHPHGLFAELMAAGRGDEPVSKPLHYLRKFHPKYNADGLDALVEAEGVEDWVQLFLNKADYATNPDLPTLHSWEVKSGAEGSASRIVCERNPYYWKVDTEGNQLPYIDQVVFNRVNNNEALLLNAVNGDLDIHGRHINTLQNKPVLSRGRQDGDYDFYDLIPDTMNVAMFALNLTHTDPVKREVFQNKEFRIGLSHAINRAEIINVVYRRQGEPWQGAPGKDSEFYDEQLAKQYTQYDVDLANQHLDRSGYTARDGSGLRLGPDGKRIDIRIDVTVEEGPEWIDVSELIVRYWRAVGVSASSNTISRSLAEERKDSSVHDCGIQPGFGGHSAMTDPRWYFPFSGNEHAVRWVQWYTSGGSGGEEPPEIAQRQMELYNTLKETPERGRRVELMKEILSLAVDAFWAIGIAYPAKGYGIVKNNVHNVPKEMFSSTGATFPEPAPTNPCQYFIEQG